MPRHRREAGDPTKPQKCEWCDSPGTKSLLWAEGMAYIPTCDEHEQKTRNRIEKGNNDEVVGVRPIKAAVDSLEPAPFNPDWVTPETRECPWCLDEHPYDFDTNQCPHRLERLRQLYPPPDPNAPSDEPAPFEPAPFHQGNILDPVQKSLDPKVWVHPEAPDPQLNPKLNDWLHKVIYGALERNGYEGPARWLKLVMTGSLCTYQYSDSSDCDVSLFIHGLPEWSRGEMIGIMVKEFDGILLPGTSHDIQAFVVSKTLTPQDLYKPGLRSAYDLETGKWIVPPDHAMAHDTKEEYPAEMTYGYEVLDKMDRLLKYEPDKAVQYYNVLHRRRQRDQTAGKGDFSGSNIAYKMLMNRGYGDRLRELGVKIY